ncbi:MAG: hypothetical protein Q4B85_12095, partial [Lachnospiraceae bacterium]|nr:hypothetical protein [Lachnospiraceae bacterium]
MDKTEYQLKLNELTECVQNREYEAALKIVEEIDWTRVKSIRTLSMVADIYEVNRDYRNCKRILLLAYEKTAIGKNLLFRLTEISVKLNEMEDAEKYYNQFLQVAPNDNSRHLLKYKLLKAKDAPLEERIRVLETYKDYEYTERWAYELAELYHKAGMDKECVDACDDMILWFSEGRYVLKAMELKKQHEGLAPYQQRLYEKAITEKPESETPKIVLPVPTKAAAEASFAKAQHVDSKMILQKMDEAGAAITRDVLVETREQAMPLTDAAMDRYSVTSKEFLGKTANLSLELEKSIRKVFANQEKEINPVQADLFVPEALEIPEPEVVAEADSEADSLEEKLTEAIFDVFSDSGESAEEETAESIEEKLAEEEAQAEAVAQEIVEETAEPETVVEAIAGEVAESVTEVLAEKESQAEAAAQELTETAAGFDAVAAELDAEEYEETAEGASGLMIEELNGEDEVVAFDADELLAEAVETEEAAEAAAEAIAAEIEETAAEAVETEEATETEAEVIAAETEETAAEAVETEEATETETEAIAAETEETAAE